MTKSQHIWARLQKNWTGEEPPGHRSTWGIWKIGSVPTVHPFAHGELRCGLEYLIGDNRRERMLRAKARITEVTPLLQAENLLDGYRRLREHLPGWDVTAPEWAENPYNVSKDCWAEPRVIVGWLHEVERIEPIPVPAGGYTRSGWQRLERSELPRIRHVP